MRHILSLTLVFLLAGCQSSRVTVDYDTAADFSGIKRYTWAETKGDTEEGLDPLLAKRVQSAIERNLAALTVKPAVESQNPDVLVRYYVGSHTVEEEPKSRGSIGFGGGSGGSVLGVGLSIPLGSSKVVKETKIIVDLLNPGSGKLVWRGTNLIKISDETPEEITTKVNQAVTEMFKKFPPDQA